MTRNQGNGANEVEDIVFVETSDPAGRRAVAQYFGELTPKQKKVQDDLTQLDTSLRGPEDMLDQGNYGRPIPAAAEKSNRNVKRNR